jgi:pimeloyl-ACP methyl ester carboxylesterase
MSPTRAAQTLIATERDAELGGIETRRLSVDGSGVPFLLLHGFADSADTWREVLEQLGGHGRGAVAIDLAGFGAAAPPAAERTLLEQWDSMVADAAHELSAAHGGARVHVAGNSLGGCLAIRAAQRDDLPVEGIVPIAPAGLDMAGWFPLIESQRLIRLLELSPLPVPERVVRELVGRVYANLAFSSPGRASAEAVAAFTQHIPSVARGNAVLGIGRRLLPELRQPFELERISCPLLLVWGERDRMVYTTGAERVLRTVPYSDIEIIADCGHCPQVEVPERLTEMLLGFPEAYEHP